MFQKQKPHSCYINILNLVMKNVNSTRHAIGKNFTLPKANSNSLKRTAMYRGMYEWNQIPKQISQIGNKSLFKSTIKEYLGSDGKSTV